MRERDIEDYLVARVKAIKGEVRKVQWVGRRGAPDRLVMLGHLAKAPTVWVELKAPGQKLRPYQAREHARMAELGQCVRVIDSLEGVEELIQGLR